MNDTLVIYIASPYTNGDQFENVRNSILTARVLRGLGILPFLPLLSAFWHLIWPESYEFWMEMGLEWVPKCDAVFRLPGESPGADDEVALAQSLGIPIFYTVKEVEKWLTNNQ